MSANRRMTRRLGRAFATLAATWRLLRASWRALLSFELIYRAVSIALVGPLLKLLLDAAMAAQGYAYLTYENVVTFVTRPVSVAFVVLLALGLAAYTLVDVAAVHYVLGLASKGERARATDALRFGVRQGLRAFLPRNLLLPLYALVLIPLLDAGVASSFVGTIKVPEFIMEYVASNPLYTALYVIAATMGGLLLFKMVYSFAYFVYDGCGFVEAMRRSRRASKGHWLADVCAILFVEVVVEAALYLGVGAVGFAVLLLVQLFFGEGHAVLVSVTTGLVLAGVFVSSLLVVSPVTYATVLARLQSRGGDVRQPQPVEALEQMGSRRVRFVAVYAVLVASLAGGCLFVWDNVLRPSLADASRERHVLVTAHRGGAFAAPENTMAAFERALADGADVCELDVQMSRDGQVFVSHDSNFRRVSGVDKGAWELDYDQILELDATGRTWRREYPTQRYPLLDEVIMWADEVGMRLNIELKPTGHETNFEKAVAEVINAHGFGTRCVVTSQSYDTVAKMKEAAPEVTCAYVTALAYGDLCRLEAADAFSVEETSATPALVAYLHEHHKTVLAWTVNSEATVERVVVNGVDDVITDDVPMARAVVDEANEQTPLEHMLDRVAGLFAP